MEFSTPFFNEFADAFSKPDGYQLARTLSPDVPTEKLRKIHKSQNAHNIKSVLKRGFQGNAGLIDGLDQQELQGWVEVYAAYWNAAGVIVTARESTGGSNKVSARGDPAEAGALTYHGIWLSKADSRCSRRSCCGQRSSRLGQSC
jgi:hypothetical protein